ncbi:hypothetical protein ACL02R_27200 [Streptomyces sp. MS19]|uniref:DUF7919 family protein n=1 Tax=Streptomyces sp. MS19 TaxID=3385972 RepID=UPI0039A3674F
MTHFADLTPYTYLPGTVPPGVTALNVGWLAAPHDHPTGEPPAGFTERLGLLCRDERRAQTRGMHACDRPHADGTPGFPVNAAIAGASVLLGTAEVRVVTPDGVWLCAPTMVHHYVTHHAYLPPPAFTEAVLAGRVAPAA